MFWQTLMSSGTIYSYSEKSCVPCLVDACDAAVALRYYGVAGQEQRDEPSQPDEEAQARGEG